MTPAEEVRTAADQLREDDQPLFADLLDRVADEMFRGDATVRNRLCGDGSSRVAVHQGVRPLGERPDWTAALAAARDINKDARGGLKHALAEALSRNSEPFADHVTVVASGRRGDGTVAEYRAYAGRDGTSYTAASPDAGEAIGKATKLIEEARDGR